MRQDGFELAGRVSDFREGRGRVVKIAGTDVAVFKVGGRFFALRDACPHMGASLADGKLVGGCVECHWHHWRFDLRTGQGDQRSWAVAAVYQVRVERGELWLKPPERVAPPAADEPPEGDGWVRWDPERFLRKRRAASDRSPDGEERADQGDGQPDDDQQSGER
ncbi:MAG TPA: Rieske 2Fe-2S domain-containing protein [Candidatus Polarisedimenticolaceae bacterium]|nr:Rieske 2Fe-2S domain-containing protein [Candidatus Polarisedimenticolaceae bacterium]